MDDAFSWSTFAKWIFAVLFLLSFIFMKGIRRTEFMGLAIFTFVFLIFGLSLGKSVMDFFMASELTVESTIGLWTLFLSLGLSVAAGIMLLLTVFKLQEIFKGTNDVIHLTDVNRDKMDTLETIFITVTMLLTVKSAYTFYTPSSIYDRVYDILKSSTTAFGGFLDLVTPLIVFSLGTVLNKRLDDRCDSADIQAFKSNFKTTFYLLIAMFGLSLGKRLSEDFLFPWLRKWTNGLWMNPGIDFGDLGFLNTGLSLVGAVLFVVFLVLLATKHFVEAGWTLLATVIVTLRSVIFRWDGFIDLAKLVLTLCAVVYAGFSIRDYIGLSSEDTCFKYDLKNLYIWFIVILFVFFGLTVISPYRLTEILTFVARYFSGITVLALSAYLVYLTNDLAHLSRSGLVG